MQTKGTSKEEKKKEKNTSKEICSSLPITPSLPELSSLQAFRGRQSKIDICRQWRDTMAERCVRAPQGEEGLKEGKKMAGRQETHDTRYGSNYYMY